MTENKLRKELEKIKCFKNITTSENKSKGIFDIYVRIVMDENDVKDILLNIKDLDFTYCDFGVFEFWFNIDLAENIIKELQNKF